MKKNNPKLNDGCIKIFKLLLLLYQDKADYESVTDIFKNDFDDEQSTNNIQVILNKYLNTLKVFGINVKKENNQYKLLNNLYAMNFSEDDLKSINILANSIETFPEENISSDIKKFIHELKIRMNYEDRTKLNNTSNYDFSFYYANLREQIEQCVEICKEKFIIEVLYLKNNKEIKTKCTPKDVIYDTRNAYLKVYDLNSKTNIEIPISKILSIVKLPQIASPTELTTTVVYKLKNRLAKTYKVKENEYSDGYDENGNLIVINKNEPFDKLLQRLMRYTYNCEIISPKNLRHQMIDLINKTLENYEE